MKRIGDYMSDSELISELERLEHLDENNAQTEESFGLLTPYEQKVFLCNALCVPTYLSNDILREKLEVIINAK